MSGEPRDFLFVEDEEFGDGEVGEALEGGEEGVYFGLTDFTVKVDEEVEFGLCAVIVVVGDGT